MLVYDELILREPGLYVPGRKPVGPVRARDESSPPASALLPFVEGGGNPYDYFRRQLVSLEGGASWQQQSVLLNAPGEQINIGPILAAGSPYIAEGTFMFSVVPNLAYNSGIGKMVGSDSSDGSIPEFTMWIFSDSNLYWGWNGFSGDTRVVLSASATNWVQGKKNFYALSWADGGTTRMYHACRNAGIGFREIGSQGGCSTGAFANDFLLGGRESNPDNSFPGRYEFFMGVPRQLTTSEIKSIADDPYQFLVPA